MLCKKHKENLKPNDTMSLFRNIKADESVKSFMLKKFNLMIIFNRYIRFQKENGVKCSCP